jgi:hypothetical protein
MLPLRPGKTTSTGVTEAERVKAVIAYAKNGEIPVAINGVNIDTARTAKDSRAVIKPDTVSYN